MINDWIITALNNEDFSIREYDVLTYAVFLKTCVMLRNKYRLSDVCVSYLPFGDMHKGECFVHIRVRDFTYDFDVVTMYEYAHKSGLNSEDIAVKIFSLLERKIKEHAMKMYLSETK